MYKRSLDVTWSCVQDTIPYCFCSTCRCAKLCLHLCVYLFICQAVSAVPVDMPSCFCSTCLYPLFVCQAVSAVSLFTNTHLTSCGRAYSTPFHPVSAPLCVPVDMPSCFCTFVCTCRYAKLFLHLCVYLSICQVVSAPVCTCRYAKLCLHLCAAHMVVCTGPQGAANHH